MKNKNALYLVTASLCLPFAGMAMAESFTVNYTNQNKWAKTGDGTGFSAFMKAAKQKDAKAFTVVLPKNEDTSRALSTERLKVLLSILEKSLGHGVLIQESEGDTAVNTLQFDLK